VKKEGHIMSTVKASYLQRGETLDYINNSADTVMEAGTVVVLGTRIGVIGTDIPPGQAGSVHMSGVFEIAKTSANAIEMGTTVYFDGNGITEAGGASSPTAGYAAAAATADDSTILVQING